MTKIPLKEYLNIEGKSQDALATAVGYRQSAISNMLKAKRNIFVIVNDNGEIHLHEEKIIASQKLT